jgi:hypothetical protein
LKKDANAKVLDNGNMLIEMPVKIVPQAGRNRILSEDVLYLENCDSPLVINLARAFHWQSLIDDGRYENMKELAKALGVENGAVTKVVRLTLLSPKIIHKIIIGDITINSNILREKIPLLWKDQEKLYLEQ